MRLTVFAGPLYLLPEYPNYLFRIVYLLVHFKIKLILHNLMVSNHRIYVFDFLKVRKNLHSMALFATELRQFFNLLLVSAHPLHHLLQLSL